MCRSPLLSSTSKNWAQTKTKPALNKILKQHKSSRKKIQSDVEDGLEKLKADETLQAIQNQSQQIIAQQANQPFDSAQVLEKAHWHITCRLNDFLSMKQYVYMENEKLKASPDAHLRQEAPLHNGVLQQTIQRPTQRRNRFD